MPLGPRPWRPRATALSTAPSCRPEDLPPEILEANPQGYQHRFFVLSDCHFLKPDFSPCVLSFAPMERRGTGCRSRFARLLGFRGRLVSERFVDARRVFLRRQTQKPIGDCGPGTCLRGCALLPCEGTALRRGKSRKIILPPISVVKKL